MLIGILNYFLLDQRINQENRLQIELIIEFIVGGRPHIQPVSLAI